MYERMDVYRIHWIFKIQYFNKIRVYENKWSKKKENTEEKRHSSFYLYYSIFYHMSICRLCSFVPNETPWSFVRVPRPGWRERVKGETYVGAYVYREQGEFVVRKETERKPRRRHDRADVAEIPFEKSLERRHSYKWTRQPTSYRLPLLPRILCLRTNS